MEVCTSMVSDFSEVNGSISLKLCIKNVKQIFDIIENGSLAAIFDVNTLAPTTWRTSLGFRSSLVQRDCIGGATCMPFISCLVSKVATEWPYLLFYPHSQGYSHQTFLYRPVVFCSSSNCFTNFYTISSELYRPTGLLFINTVYAYSQT